MKCLFKRILKKIGRDLITLFTRRVKNRILLVYDSASGSNTYALWKFAGDELKSEYDIVMYRDSAEDGLGISGFFKKYRLLASSQMIITTHGSYKPGRKHIHLQLWHGAFIKKNGVMVDRNPDGSFKPQKSWLKADYIMSYSETYTTFFNACMATDPDKYIITGAPRNDFLFSADGRSNIQKIFGNMDDCRLIFFMPTFRDYYGGSQGDKNNNNLFGFNEFLAEEFDKFLTVNKCRIVFKPHPHEEALVLEYLRSNPSDNILILKDEDLLDNDLDLYELLNACDILLTDYSSVFYDYLLLDRPMIFAPVDIASYIDGRGFLVESFDDWTPGPKVFDQKALQNEIRKCLSDGDYYGERRKMMRNLQHRYKDGESSKRMWEFINKVLSGGAGG